MVDPLGKHLVETNYRQTTNGDYFGYNPTANFPIQVLRAFPGAEISWEVDAKRQGIVDSWPADVDDSAARHDWGHAPRYGFDAAFGEYLIPTIRNRYA